jgi:hypothetical protein
MLKLAALTILALSLIHSATGLAAQHTAEKSTQVRNHSKKKAKKPDAIKADSKFNPTTFIKTKQRNETSISASRPQSTAPTPVVIGNQAVVCKPSVKSNEPCSGSECVNKKPVKADPVEKPVAMIENNEAITQEVMKTIRDNCTPPESEKAFVKPVFELGIKEPEKGSTDKREMIPKVGIQAAF